MSPTGSRPRRDPRPNPLPPPVSASPAARTRMTKRSTRAGEKEPPTSRGQPGLGPLSADQLKDEHYAQPAGLRGCPAARGSNPGHPPSRGSDLRILDRGGSPLPRWMTQRPQARDSSPWRWRGGTLAAELVTERQVGKNTSLTRVLLTTYLDHP